MFKRLFKKDPEGEIVAVFDIGSDSVAGSLVRFSQGEEPIVLCSKRLTWSSAVESDYDSILRSMRYSLANVTRYLLEKGSPARPARFVVTLSALWYAYEPHKVLYERNTPFVITEALVKDLQRKELKSFIEKQKEEQGDEFALLESVVIDTKVNGYPTENPAGKKAKSFYMTMYLSIAPASLTEIIGDVIGSVFHQEDIVFQTASLVSYVTSRDVFASEKDYIFIDVGGELTDIAVVKDGIFVASLSFPLGTQFFYTQLANKLKTSLFETKSLVSAYKKESLTEKEQKKVAGFLTECLSSYEKHIHMSLMKMKESQNLPDTIYTVGYGDFTKEIDALLAEEAVGHHNSFEKPFIVKPLSVNKIFSELRYQKEVKRDLFIAMSCLYINQTNY